ncbi:MAG: ABC transporter substrate-binding protein [Bdellovibrionales bacterium]
MRLYICLFLLTLCHCEKQKLSKDTLYVALDAEVKNLDPRTATDANSMRISELIFSGLVKIGPQLKVLPDSAYKWEQKNLDYIFYLKPLKFSNGRSVTKKDLLFSFNEFMRKGSPFFSAFKQIQSVQVSKQKENWIVKIRLKEFSATFLSSDLPVIKILPQLEIMKSKKDFLKSPIGSGSYKVVHKNSRELLLKRRHALPHKPDYLSFQFIRDSFTRTQKMLTGQIDISPSVIPLDKIHRFPKDKFQILTQASLSTTYLLLNLKNNLLKNKEVRRALSLSLNKKEIIKYKLKGFGIPALSILQPENRFFNPALKAYPYDLHQSQKIIEKLNLKGKVLKLTTTNNRDSINKAKILSNQIKQSGLNIQIEQYEWGTFYKDLNRGHYQIALMKWVGITDPDIYRIAFHSENQAPQGRNRSFYSDKNMDQLLETGLKLKDQNKRKNIYNKIQRQIFKDIAIIPLWHDMEVSILKKNIKNYQLFMNGSLLALEQVSKE